MKVLHVLTITEGMSSTGADQAWKIIARCVIEVEIAMVGLMKTNEASR